MDTGPGPPQQSPEDYSARERRERTGVAVGISIGVFLLFAGPLCLVYFANWRRRRRLRRQDRDLEGTTAVSQGEKDGTIRFERTGAETLTTTVVAREDAVLSEAEIAQWRESQRGRAETDLERLKRDPTSPLNYYSTPDASKKLSPDAVLGLDKSSYLQSLPVTGSSPSDTGGKYNVTVLPSQLPSFEDAIPQGESSNKIQSDSSGDECVSPWMVEHEPNPVIFKHLLGPKDARVGDVESTAQESLGGPSTQFESPHNQMDDLEEEHRYTIESQSPAHSWDQPSHFENFHETTAAVRETFKESSPSEDTSSASPSTSNGSQDSSDPLMGRRSMERDSQSPTTFRVPELYQQSPGTSGSHPNTLHVLGKPSCQHCNRTFKTTGQLNAHIHRKHVRRYSCTICPSTFHLKTDLKRHELTVHRKQLPAEARGFRCTNPGCSIPEKVFLRRDNFDRHVARCARRAEPDDTGPGPSGDAMLRPMG